MLQSSGICLLSHMGFAQLSMELFAMVGLFKNPPHFWLISLTILFFACKCLLWFFYPHCPRKCSTKVILWTVFCSCIEKDFFSGLLFLYSNKECGETENLILLLYSERSHKEHPIRLSSTAFNAFKEGRPFEHFWWSCLLNTIIHWITLV